MRSRAVVMVVVLIGTACGGEHTHAGRGPSAREWLVTRGTLQTRVLLTGELEAAAWEELLVPRTPMRALKIRWIIDHGTDVKAGDKVAEFDNSELVAKIDELEISLLQAMNDYDATEAKERSTLADREADVSKAKLELAKAKLYASVPEDVYPTRVYQDKQLARQRAEVAVERAGDALASHRSASHHKLKIAKLEVSKAEADYNHTRSSLEALTLRAPRSGPVFIPNHPWQGRPWRESDEARAGWVVVKQPSSMDMKVIASLSDVDDGRVRPGMAVRCTLDAHPEHGFDGKVTKVGAVARQPSGNTLRRAFDVGIELSSVDTVRVRPGMSVKVEVLENSEADALLVPRGALSGVGKTARAHTPAGPVDVEVGACSAQQCVVVRGLELGQRLEAAP